MNALEMMNIINRIETELPVNQWTIGDLHIWPLVRIQLGMDLFYRNNTISPSPPIRHSIKEAVKGLFDREFRFLVARWTDRSHNLAGFPQAPALFLSDGISFISLAGRSYDRFCDPLRDYLRAIGVESVMLTPGDRFDVPRHSESKFIQPMLDWIQVKNKLARPERSLSQNLPRWDGLGKSRTNLLSGAIPSIAVIRKEVGLILAYADYFEKVLERVRPQACFLVSFYWLIGYGLLLACRRKGIPSIDIQHGLQGELHQSYGRWLNTPAQGYELLPSWFWCWHEADVDAIEKWSKATNGVHRAVVGGNLFLETCRQGIVTFVQECDEVLKEKMSERSYHCHVLVTLQRGLLTNDFVLLLLKAIADTHAAFLWWIRLHPTMDAKEQTTVKETFGLCKNVELALATDLPLYALLRHVSVHVTHCSSVVLEAERFGVRSVVCSRFGLELFPDQVAKGIVVHATSVDELKACIQWQSVNRLSLDNLADESERNIEQSHRLMRQFLASKDLPGGEKGVVQ